MSNAAFVIPKKTHQPEVLDRMVREAVADVFPTFAITTIKEGDKITGWLLAHVTYKELAFNIWLSTHKKRQALQIPHKHCYEVMWWVEYEIRERLAGKLDAKQFDEGVGNVENATEFYQTYNDYLNAVYPTAYRLLKVRMAKDEARALPADLRRRLGF